METKNVIFILDAGGTNFKFSAVQDYHEIIKPFNVETKSSSLEEQLKKIIGGFRETEKLCGCAPTAISFCFPGPADYPNGIIGKLENLPFFTGGVALKDMLENEFHVPVFINNDGDLFAYGEALGGILPEINTLLEQQGNPKRYKNLLGLTLGTGFGGGIVLDGVLLGGDNSSGGEINRFGNFLHNNTSAEDSVTIRAIKRIYAQETGIVPEDAPEPFDIYEIAMGRKEGNKAAAQKAWDELAAVLANVICGAASLIDGLVVIGGGLSGAWPVFLPKVMENLKKSYTSLDGKVFDRMEITPYNLMNENDLVAFTAKTGKMIRVPFSNKEVWYDDSKKFGIAITKLGTTSAVAIGAYAYAMKQLAAAHYQL